MDVIIGTRIESLLDKKRVNDQTTRDMLRNRDLESASIIGTLGILRVQRGQWFGIYGDLSNFVEDLSLWSRRTWAIVPNRRGELVRIGRPSSGAKQVLVPKPLHKLCEESGIGVPFRFTRGFKRRRPHPIRFHC